MAQLRTIPRSLLSCERKVCSDREAGIRMLWDIRKLSSSPRDVRLANCAFRRVFLLKLLPRVVRILRFPSGLVQSFRPGRDAGHSHASSLVARRGGKPLALRRKWQRSPDPCARSQQREAIHPKSSRKEQRAAGRIGVPQLFQVSPEVMPPSRDNPPIR